MSLPWQDRAWAKQIGIRLEDDIEVPAAVKTIPTLDEPLITYGDLARDNIRLHRVSRQWRRKALWTYGILMAVVTVNIWFGLAYGLIWKWR